MACLVQALVASSQVHSAQFHQMFSWLIFPFQVVGSASLVSWYLSEACERRPK